jgi:ABC-type uncharacterized transport system auxiliary subunit
MNRRAVLALPATAALLAAGGCGTEPPPPDNFYELSPADSGRRFGEPLLAGTLVVERFAADGVVAERPVLYKTAEGPRLRQYTYHYWSQTPGAMLRDAAIREYRRANVAGRVTSPAARLLPDYRMTGAVERLYHRRQGAESAAAMAVEITITRARDGEPVLMKRYTRKRPAATARTAAPTRVPASPHRHPGSLHGRSGSALPALNRMGRRRRAGGTSAVNETGQRLALVLQFLDPGLHRIPDRDHTHEPVRVQDGHVPEALVRHGAHDFVDVLSRPARGHVAAHQVARGEMIEAAAVVRERVDDVALGENPGDAAIRLQHHDRADTPRLEHRRNRRNGCRPRHGRDVATLPAQDLGHLHALPPGSTLRTVVPAMGLRAAPPAHRIRACGQLP